MARREERTSKSLEQVQEERIARCGGPRFVEVPMPKLTARVRFTVDVTITADSEEQLHLREGIVKHHLRYFNRDVKHLNDDRRNVETYTAGVDSAMQACLSYEANA
jgi:hypothetical protein